MPRSSNAPTPDALQKRILDLSRSGLSLREIGRMLGIHNTTVMKYMQRGQTETLTEQIKAVLAKSPSSYRSLSRALGKPVSEIRDTIREMCAKGFLCTVREGVVQIIEPSLGDSGALTIDMPAEGTRFGVVTDSHLCNRHSRLDVLRAAYDYFEREGITTVFHAGNWIDGEHRFNRTELIVAPGMQRQIDYMLQEYPQRKGVKTYYIAGDDHEGWYSQREGVEVGRYLEGEAHRIGRRDLVYLGYAEADVTLRRPRGRAMMRVLHPGGGSAYAISYTDQKRTESYQGGEKPHIEVVGHYHKFNHGYPREVHTIQGGCTCDQTLFMRKKRIQAHVGFVVLNVGQDPRGAISRCGVEWHPFYDRKYHAKF